MNSYLFSDKEDQFEEMEYYDPHEERKQRKGKKMADPTSKSSREFGKHHKSGNDKRWRSKEQQF